MIASDIAHFRTFGFVVLRRAFEPRPLEQELDRALEDAYRSRVELAVGGSEIRFRYVPLMCERTPVSLSILERLAPCAAELLGAPALPVRAKGVLYSGATGWHRDDDDYGLASVGFLGYLERLDADNGALRVLPGSHRSEYGGALEGYTAGAQAGLTEQTLEAQVKTLPSFAVQTEPGDLIAFDERLYHASAGGRNRRQWRVDYVADPRTADEAQSVRAYLLRTYPPDWDGGYDVDRYPTYGSHWLQSGRPWVERLRELGAYDAASAEEAFARSCRA